jgi:cytochrome c oxidase assembly protein subunit 11
VTTPQPTAARPNHTSWLFGLGAVAVMMLCFGLFAMRPLYGLWCRMSGTQLKPNAQDSGMVVTDRKVTVYFEAVNFDGLPVRFWADQPEQQVLVGGEFQNTYHFENTSDRPLSFRPIHQISPVAAGLSFTMRICFCFTNQTVGPHETKTFPVVYRLKPDLNPRTSIITLRYGLFAIDATKAADPVELKKQEERMGDGIISPRTVLPGSTP